MCEKICVECKRSQQRQPTNGLGWMYFYPVYECTHSAKRDVITGAFVGLLPSCQDMRAEVSHIENKCGPEGKHWKSKF